MGIMGSSLWHLIVQADIISQIVLLVLLGMSLLCWTIFIMKLISVRQKTKQIALLFDAVKGAQTNDDLQAIALRYNALYGNVLLVHHLIHGKVLFQEHKDMHYEMKARNWEHISESIYMIAESMIIEEESYLSVLSTCASIATLLGLFGTVWGLIHAFVRISQSQIADITVVAPGIAEALITTLAGLLVAIPALAMYNYMLSRIRSLEQLVMQLTTAITSVIRSVFLCVGI